MSDVIVIGGGLAGLAASVALAEAGVTVTLLESRPRLGGRASSFEDATTGELIDNCQHVAMGCCTNFRHFCRVTGLDAHFRRERELYFIEPPPPTPSRPPRVCHFSALPLPAPLHLAAAFMRLTYLTWRDKRELARGLKALARERPEMASQQTFADWLTAQRQSAAVIERFWSIVLVSALSESLDRVSVAAARKVFVDGFLANRQGWEVWLPRVPLDELYSNTLTQWLTARGVDIRLKTGVERLIADDDRATAVELRGGERLSAKHIVLAVPHHRVLPLLPEALRVHPQFTGLEQLETAPIASVHLWFDRPITSLPHAVLVGRLSQWLFNRSQRSEVRSQRAEGRVSGMALATGCGAEDREQAGKQGAEFPISNFQSQISNQQSQFFNYQVVISNARDVSQCPQTEVISAVVAELKAIWPEAGLAELRHSRMIVEHKAVFSPLPGSETLRPQQQSPLANLQLAGDWTQTGWPATMEGAVRSGFLAAENVARSFGRDSRMLQPDLPVSWLTRWWLGEIVP